MKNIKFFLPLIAIMLIAAGVFAMKANKKVVHKHIFTAGYYQFNGDATSSSDRLDSSKYDYVSASAPDETSACAQGETTLCGIFTDGDGIHPTIPATGDLHTALQNNEPRQGEVFMHD